jgi:formamidase
MPMKSIRLNYGLRCAGEPAKGHNRWHGDIPPALEVEPGEEVELDTRDALDGQVTASTMAGDLPKVDMTLVHPLTGPVFVAGAQPGDLLEVDIRELKPADWGYTIQMPGFGFLRDEFPDPYIVKWRIADGWATSAELPGVRLRDGSFMGTIGVAPSEELRREILRREEDLRERGGFVLPPEPAGAVPSREPIASEALRTIPPRENGGNLDIKQLSAGARLLLPVFVPGALFSVGDAHFAQGDGESCGTAVEMCASVLLKFSLRKGEAARNKIRFPRFERDDYFVPPELAAPKRFLATTGMCIREGVNESENATMAAHHALMNMIALLMERGWSRQQAYAICSVAVDLRLSEVVDVPNFVVSALLPLAIFDK